MSSGSLDNNSLATLVEYVAVNKIAPPTLLSFYWDTTARSIRFFALVENVLRLHQFKMCARRPSFPNHTFWPRCCLQSPHTPADISVSVYLTISRSTSSPSPTGVHKSAFLFISTFRCAKEVSGVQQLQTTSCKSLIQRESLGKVAYFIA